MKNGLEIDPKSTRGPISGKPALPVVIDKIKSVLNRRRRGLGGAAGTAAAMILSQLPGPHPAEARKPLACPADAVEPPWVDTRREMQLATAARFRAFVGFAFTDRRRESGIGFVNVTTADTGKNYRPSHYDHGNGVAAADVDGDGLADIYFSNQVGANELWRNLGGGEFADITASSGTSLAEALGVAASFGDTDNDGDPDLYATTVLGGNFLFANDGAGRFTDATAASGLGYSGHSSASVLFDYDRDGLLDLFLCNVGVYTTGEVLEAPVDPLNPGEGESYRYSAAHADAFAGHLKPERTERSILYRNEGGNRFSDVSEATGLIDTSWSGDASPIDANEDGWPDLYVLDMQGNDDYFENVRGQSFVRRSREVFPKTPWGSMGVKSFDWDNDGDFDLFVSDMHSDMSEEVGPGDEKRKADIQYSEEFLASGGHSIFGNAFYRNEGGSYLEISDGIGAENYWPWGPEHGRPERRRLRRRLPRLEHELPLPVRGQHAAGERPGRDLPRRRVHPRGRAAARRPHDQSLVPARLRGSGQGARPLRGAGRPDRDMGGPGLALLGDLRHRGGRRPRHRNQRVQLRAPGLRQRSFRKEADQLPRGEARRPRVEPERHRRRRHRGGRKAPATGR